MTPRALHILAAIALVLASASMSARSVREVLGDKLEIEHPNVIELNLSSKEIDDLDGLREVGRRYPDLRGLNLGQNKIKEIPGGTFIGFSNLVGLKLMNNAITSLSDGVHVISDFVRAKEEGREQLLSSFAGLPRLRELDLHGNDLSSLPESFSDLTSLQELYLSKNKLSRLPESFGNLRALEVLGLSNNALIHLPKSFSRLIDLQLLHLGKNQLAVVPRGIFLRSNKLEALDLSENRIAHLYDGAPRESLSTREAQRRGERVIWSSLAGLTSLTVLSLKMNKLKRLPESFGNLSALEDLELQRNELLFLPDSFRKLSALKELDLGYNKLGAFPESLSNLKALEELNLDSNQLPSLPESIGNLSALKELTLYGNKLKSLPASFNRLASLSYLVLSNNYLGTTYNISWVERPGWRDPTISPLVERLRDLPLHKLHLGDNGLQEKVINQVKAALPDAMVGL